MRTVYSTNNAYSHVTLKMTLHLEYLMILVNSRGKKATVTF